MTKLLLKLVEIPKENKKTMKGNKLYLGNVISKKLKFRALPKKCDIPELINK